VNQTLKECPPIKEILQALEVFLTYGEALKHRDLLSENPVASEIEFISPNFSNIENKKI